MGRVVLINRSICNTMSAFIKRSDRQVQRMRKVSVLFEEPFYPMGNMTRVILVWGKLIKASRVFTCRMFCLLLHATQKNHFPHLWSTILIYFPRHFPHSQRGMLLMHSEGCGELQGDALRLCYHILAERTPLLGRQPHAMVDRGACDPCDRD